MTKQSTSHLFMIEPESFYVNEQTAFTNHYQQKATDETPEVIAEKALNFVCSLVYIHKATQNALF